LPGSVKANIVIDDRQSFTTVSSWLPIVEREALRDEEKPLIADVYLNRLKKKMRLQSDPTIAYILEQQGVKHSKIFYNDTRIESPYNTYLIRRFATHPHLQSHPQFVAGGVQSGSLRLPVLFHRRQR